MARKHTCEEKSPDEKELLRYQTLKQIVNQLESANYDVPSALVEDPTFILLKELTKIERKTGIIPEDADLQGIVRHLRKKDYASLQGFLVCNVAFISLSRLADQDTTRLNRGEWTSY